MGSSSIREPREIPQQNVNQEFLSDKQQQEKKFGEGSYCRAARHYFRAAEQFAKSGNLGSAAQPGSIQDSPTLSPGEGGSTS